MATAVAPDLEARIAEATRLHRVRLNDEAALDEAARRAEAGKPFVLPSGTAVHAQMPEAAAAIMAVAEHPGDEQAQARYMRQHTRRTHSPRLRARTVRLVRATRTGRATTSRRTASHASSTRTTSTGDGGGEPGEPAGPARSADRVERSPREGNRKQPAPAGPEVVA